MEHISRRTELPSLYIKISRPAAFPSRPALEPSTSEPGTSRQYHYTIEPSEDRGQATPRSSPAVSYFRCSSSKRRACGDHVSRHKIPDRTLGVVEGSNTNARSGRIPLVFYASVAPEHLLGPRHQEISHHFLCNAAAAAPSSTLPFPGEEGQFRALTA